MEGWQGLGPNRGRFVNRAEGFAVACRGCGILQWNPRAAEAAELLGWEPEEIADPAATDGAYLSTYGVPTVDALSAIAEQIHTTEERVRIPSIRDRTALCAAMLGLLG